MTNDKTDILGQFGFELDAALFYDAIVKSTDDYVYIVNMKTDTSLISENMVRDFELPGRIVPGLVPLWGSLIHERDRARYDESIEQMLSGLTDVHDVEYQVRNRKNEYVWVVCRGVLQRDQQGSPAMFAGIVTNLSHRGKVDYVTGLFMQQECERVVEECLSEGQSGGILLLGLDDFSGINNLKGHIYGDSVLRQFAQNVQRLLPDYASIYRHDGDQFVIVCQNTSYGEIALLYEVINSYSDCRHEVDGIQYYCTVSGGIAVFCQDGSSYTELLTCASGALETSKHKGKNKCTLYDEELIHTRLRSLEIMDRLRSSVMNHMEGFSVVYQPIVRSSDTKIAEAEALLRWSCKDMGSVSPLEFIPLLESSGLIIPVGKWVLEQSVRQCCKWLACVPDFVMNVNCSYLQMLDEDFVRSVREIIERYGLDPCHIVLELTESRFVTDQDRLNDTFMRLRSLNIRLAMDDFGTGYSSLSCLSCTPADIVKIDREFIRGICDQSHSFNRSFIGSVINLCHSVGISVCAEGVEEKDELETVLRLKADSVQGFYFSKPVTPDEFEKQHIKHPDIG